jgi:hypothetical protein
MSGDVMGSTEVPEVEQVSAWLAAPEPLIPEAGTAEPEGAAESGSALETGSAFVTAMPAPAHPGVTDEAGWAVEADDSAGAAPAHLRVVTGANSSTEQKIASAAAPGVSAPAVDSALSEPMGTAAEAATAEAENPTEPAPPPQPGRPMGYLMGMVVALGTLIVFAAVVFGVLVGAGALLHHFRPNRQFDVFRALHETIVTGVLIGIGVFWVLPPHPWSQKPKERRSRRSERSTSPPPATSGVTEVA